MLCQLMSYHTMCFSPKAWSDLLWVNQCLSLSILLALSRQLWQFLGSRKAALHVHDYRVGWKVYNRLVSRITTHMLIFRVMLAGLHSKDSCLPGTRWCRNGLQIFCPSEGLCYWRWCRNRCLLAFRASRFAIEEDNVVCQTWSEHDVF